MAFVYILAMLILFSLSIFVHELGHFLAARALGLVADVFSIGMGRAVWKRKIGATSWQIGWLPFGGYVALPQMDPNSFLEGTGPGDRRQETGDRGQKTGSDPLSPGSCPLDPAPRALPRVAPWKKIVVSIAGAAGNVAFAFLLAAIVWIVGKPSSLQEQNGVVGFIATNSPALALGLAIGDEIVAVNGEPVRNWIDISEKVALGASDTVVLRVRASAGEEREFPVGTEKASIGVRMLPGIEGMDPCLVASVDPGSGAEAAGLLPGDQILRFDGQAVYGPAHLSQLVEAAAGRPVPVEFLRGSERLTAAVESRYDETLRRHRIGIAFNALFDLDFATRTHPTPWAQVRGHATAIFSFLRALATPSTSGAAAGAVGGPVLILLMLWLMLKSSFILAIWFTGFLNVNLAIINLLPLPILDGGHVVMNLWEMIFRRPAPPRLINALANVFAVLFIALFLALTFRDSVRHLAPPVQRWWSGEQTQPDQPAVFDEKP
ncbi:MAG: PDZ domain-containing protein [Opitutae bacterium]|nr:PDZ domain-containing protein [Opitutae bacterium]